MTDCTNESNDLKVLAEPKRDFYFNREITVALLKLFKTYKPQVRCGKIRTMKQLWNIISDELSNLFHITISPSKCENRFKVLERNYKKTIYNTNKNVRRRKQFQYEKEFHDLYGKKVNIRPIILLSSNRTIVPEKSQRCDNQHLTSSVPMLSRIQSKQVAESEVVIDTSEPGPSIEKHVSPQRKSIRNRESYEKLDNILMEMKNDFKKYYEKKLIIEKEKLEIKKQSLIEKRKSSELLEKLLEIKKFQ